STTTTTFTVNRGSLMSSLSVSPSTVKRGKIAKLDIAYSNTSSERLSVSFVVRYTGQCDTGVIDSVGPFQINAGAERNANAQFHVAKDACTGLYRLTLETYVGGVLVGTTTAELTVTP
ncbi:MAG TPA: hypothetical protein VJW17_11400, partial [Pyrinomonadaceae bacterium]|nr:hypothetical protein [Pyrinomonadaceae bacterium]